jgi:hypothetical protein
LQIRPTYDATVRASYAAEEECNKINSSNVDLFHKIQPMKMVVMEDGDGQRGHIIGPSLVVHLPADYSCIEQGL